MLLDEKGCRLRMENGAVDVLGAAAGTGDKDSCPGRRGGEEAVFGEAESEKFHDGFCSLSQRHADGEDDQVEGLLYHLSHFGMDEAHPQIFGTRGVVDLGGEASDEADSLIRPAGIEELREIRSGRLNIHVKESGSHLRILVSNRPDQAKGIGTANLGAVEVSD